MSNLTRRTFIHAAAGAAVTSLTVAAESDGIIVGSAKQLERIIREKKVSATEAVHAFIARIEKVNPKLNAVVQTCFERAIEEAKAADELQSRGQTKGPLHGVPMTIKD